MKGIFTRPNIARAAGVLILIAGVILVFHQKNLVEVALVIIITVYLSVFVQVILGHDPFDGSDLEDMFE